MKVMEHGITIEQVEDNRPHPLVSGIASLSHLSPGWLEGKGLPPSSEDLVSLTNLVRKSFPKSMEVPSIVPTQEGNIIFEWISSRSRVELEFNFQHRNLEIFATNFAKNEFVEEVFEMDSSESAFKKIAQLLSNAVA
jgi:hypothetical protein